LSDWLRLLAGGHGRQHPYRQSQRKGEAMERRLHQFKVPSDTTLTIPPGSGVQQRSSGLEIGQLEIALKPPWGSTPSGVQLMSAELSA
jgi:hypothetical protein